MTIQRKIFISYRRSDNPDFVDRIRDWFIMRYGRENVFMDFDSIPPAVKFSDFIHTEIEGCDAVIAIIGSRWVELMQEKAAKFEQDYVRVEIGLALQLGKPVVPICIGGASMPEASALPPELRPLLEYNAAFLERANFLDRITRIVEAVEKSLNENDPANAQAYYQSAETKWQNKDYDGAIADGTIAIRLRPNFPLAYNTRGNARDDKGDHDGAIADYSAAIRLDPRNAIPYMNCGLAHFRKGDHSDALADFDISLRLDPFYALGYFHRGWTRFIIGDLDGALADHNEAIRLDPSSAEAYNDRGLVRKGKGDPEGALADYEEAIRLDPSYANAYFNRAQQRATKSDIQGALDDYQKYLDLGGGEMNGDQAGVENLTLDLQKRLKP